ncbi:hypothetical protein PLICBS_004193 [Purpureocillium lilacinum]|uniref:uncharacterized protein n=1 Tax=Purpureocillium lilacinum TaxID=33203 RepID=UPI00208C5E20|nr:hypothetical protein PLICBS_004193 [Purpureocillium lilacinum]
MNVPAMGVTMFRPTLIFVAKRMLSAALQGIEHGQLKISYPSPESEQGTHEQDVSFGFGTPSAIVLVKDDWFWVRALASGSVGFAEAYVNGEIDSPDLLGIFKLALLNRRIFMKLDKQSPFMTKLYSLFARTNSIEQAKRNVAAHYDLSNDMFAAFLSPDMTYSCPLWLPSHDPDYVNDSLEKAQRRKLSYHIKAARIQPSDHVLEIGTGWGSFAIQAVQERVHPAGLSDKITVLLCDYREIPKLGIRFDKVVSIEMLEHTGIEHLHEYFGVIKDLLPGDGAIATFQATMMSEAYLSDSKGTDSFVTRHIFPGAYPPSLLQTLHAIDKGSGDHFIVDRVETFGGLGRAFQEWGEAFGRSFESRIRPDLMARRPQAGDAEVEEFRRKWQASIR